MKANGQGGWDESLGAMLASGDDTENTCVRAGPAPTRTSVVVEDLILAVLGCALFGGAWLVAHTYGPTQPLVLLILPVIVATVLIALVLVHDRHTSSR